MTLNINEDSMTVDVDGVVIATARRIPSGWWEVSHWPQSFDRNQAITALMVTELLAAGRSNDDPLVAALRGELR